MPDPGPCPIVGLHVHGEELTLLYAAARPQSVDGETPGFLEAL